MYHTDLVDPGVFCSDRTVSNKIKVVSGDSSAVAYQNEADHNQFSHGQINVKTEPVLDASMPAKRYIFSLISSSVEILGKKVYVVKYCGIECRKSCFRGICNL